MSEHRRKTLRSFYCEEQLWQAFERAARESDSTIDQLLNDALRQFLGQASAQPPAVAPAYVPALQARVPTTQVPAVQPNVEHPTFAMPAVTARRPAPTPSPAVAQAPRTSALSAIPAPPPAPMGPPRAASASVPAVRAAGGMPTLFVRFEGKVYPVNKDNFVIGRGSQGTDLMIRDQNVSRKHASVIFHSGAFWIQDLGSTNGVEFRGQRVESRKIEEGDVYSVCDHEMTFTYRG